MYHRFLLFIQNWGDIIGQMDFDFLWITFGFFYKKWTSLSFVKNEELRFNYDFSNKQTDATLTSDRANFCSDN